MIARQQADPSLISPPTGLQIEGDEGDADPGSPDAAAAAAAAVGGDVALDPARVSMSSAGGEYEGALPPPPMVPGSPAAAAAAPPEIVRYAPPSPSHPSACLPACLPAAASLSAVLRDAPS
jgi:hypothetical protein